MDIVNLLSPILNEISAIITVVIIFGGSIVLAMAKTHIKQKLEQFKIAKNNKLFLETVEFDSIIQEHISSIRNSLGADRVFIMRFHNGTHFLNENLHTYKSTVTHESVMPGLVELRSIISSAPLSRYSEFILRILRSDIVIVNNISNDYDGVFGTLNFEFSISSGIFSALKNTNGEFIGILGVTWNEESISLEDSPNIDIELVKKLTSALSNYF